MDENMRRREIIDEHRGIAEAALRRDVEEAVRLLAQNMQVTTGFYAGALREAADSDTRFASFEAS